MDNTTLLANRCDLPVALAIGRRGIDPRAAGQSGKRDQDRTKKFHTVHAKARADANNWTLVPCERRAGLAQSENSSRAVQDQQPDHRVQAMALYSLFMS